jgi:hypothetical protein
MFPPPLPTVKLLIVASVSVDIEPVTPSEPVIKAEPVNGKAVPPLPVGIPVNCEPSPINEPVKNDAVTALVTFKEFNSALDPLMMTFFHDGIYLTNYGWLQQMCAAHFPYGPIIPL